MPPYTKTPSDYSYDTTPTEEDKSFHSYPTRTRLNNPQGRPLIDFVTNEWKRNPENSISAYYDKLDEDDLTYLQGEDDGWHPPRWLKALLNFRLTKRIRRLLLILILLLLACHTAWAYRPKTRWEEEQSIDRAFTRQKARERAGAGFLGTHTAALFVNMIQVKRLDEKYLPTKGEGKWKHARGRRLIFVGDVHGCKDELAKLLHKIGFEKELDHLVLTGDIIAKGPDSPGAIDLAREVGASCVRGNWDDRVLLAWEAMHRRKHGKHGLTASDDQSGDVVELDENLDETAHSTSNSRAHKTAKQLSKDQAHWLQSCPVILDIGHVDGIGRMACVHAGLVPGVRFEKQDPFQVMNMRSIDLRTLVPSEEREYTEWEKVWNRWQKHEAKENERCTVVYGHDSKRGLNIEKWSKGLDSGCVNGERLTALVVEAGGKMTLEHVKCKTNYKELAKNADD